MFIWNDIGSHEKKNSTCSFILLFVAALPTRDRAMQAIAQAGANGSLDTQATAAALASAFAAGGSQANAAAQAVGLANSQGGGAATAAIGAFSDAVILLPSFCLTLVPEPTQLMMIADCRDGGNMPIGMQHHLQLSSCEPWFPIPVSWF